MHHCGRATGVIFDLTLQHDSKGIRYIDKVKKSLANFLRTNYDEGEVFYLFHPDIIDVSTHKGEQIASISNYETDGFRFDLSFALKQTLYVIAAEVDFIKRIWLFTNRVSTKEIPLLKKINNMNSRMDLNCELTIFVIGNGFDKSVLSMDGYKSYHIDDVSHM
jgi:hypothetical protein